MVDVLASFTHFEALLLKEIDAIHAPFHFFQLEGMVKFGCLMMILTKVAQVEDLTPFKVIARDQLLTFYI